MHLEWVVLILVAVMIAVGVILEALKTAFFIPMLVVLLTCFWIAFGNPVGLLTSWGGWIIILFMLWATRILAVTLHATIKAARDRSTHTD